ncbi:venom dipeptidyl peptidase 4 isoform X1, partial [Vespula maculifrons]
MVNTESTESTEIAVKVMYMNIIPRFSYNFCLIYPSLVMTPIRWCQAACQGRVCNMILILNDRKNNKKLISKFAYQVLLMLLLKALLMALLMDVATDESSRGLSLPHAALKLEAIICIPFRVVNACAVIRLIREKASRIELLVLSLSRVMAVRHYAREYAIRIKATERNHDDNLDDSDDYGESEDHYPLIRQTTKDLTISTDIYKGISNEIRPSSKFRPPVCLHVRSQLVESTKHLISVRYGLQGCGWSYPVG